MRNYSSTKALSLWAVLSASHSGCWDRVLLACVIPRSEKTTSLLLLLSPFGKCLFLFLSFLSFFVGAELTHICHSAAGVVLTLGALGVQLPGAREFPLGR